MSTKSNFPNSNGAPIAALILALSFCLAFESRSPAQEVQSLDLSSIDASECIENGLKTSNSVTCEYKVDGKKYKTTAKLKKDTKVKEINRSSDEWAMEEKSKNILDLTTEATFCNDCGPEGKITKRMQLDMSADEIQSNAAIAQKAKDATKANIKKIAEQKREDDKAAREEKARQEDIKLCNIDEQGEAISDKKRMSCRVDQMKKMDKEEMTTYFEDHVQPEIKALLESCQQEPGAMGAVSTCKPGDMKQAAILLDQIDAAMLKNKDINESAKELRAFGSGIDNINNLNRVLANPGLTAEARQAYEQQLALQRSSLLPFQQAGYQLSSATMGTSSLGSDPYQQILNAHQAATATTTGQTNATTPTVQQMANARSGVRGGDYGQMNLNPNATPGNQVSGTVQPQLNTNVPNLPNMPTVGQPTRVAPPAPAAPVQNRAIPSGIPAPGSRVVR